MKYFRLSIFILTFLCQYNFKALANSVSAKGDERPSACSITNLTVNEFQCGDWNKHYTFNFVGVDFGTNGYKLTFSNSNVIYNYSKNDYKAFSVPATCEDNAIITLTDNDNPNCNSSLDLGKICCECILYGIEVVNSECIDLNFNASLYAYIDGSCFYVDPIIYVNDQQVSYIPFNNFETREYLIQNIQSFEPAPVIANIISGTVQFIDQNNDLDIKKRAVVDMLKSLYDFYNSSITQRETVISWGLAKRYPHRRSRPELPRANHGL